MANLVYEVIPLNLNFSEHSSPGRLSTTEAASRAGTPTQDLPPAKQVSEAACPQRRAWHGETGTCYMSFFSSHQKHNER